MDCYESPPETDASDSKLLKKMMSMMETVMDKVTKFDSLETRVRKLEDNNQLDSNIEDLVQCKVEEVMAEAKEIEDKKLNLILVNIPESNKTEKEDKVKDDQSQVTNVLNKILPGTETNFSTPTRIGRPNVGTRPRLLKISVENLSEK